MCADSGAARSSHALLLISSIIIMIFATQRHLMRMHGICQAALARYGLPACLWVLVCGKYRCFETACVACVQLLPGRALRFTATTSEKLPSSSVVEVALPVHCTCSQSSPHGHTIVVSDLHMLAAFVTCS